MKFWLEFKAFDDRVPIERAGTMSIDVREVVAVVEGHHEEREKVPVAMIHLRAVGSYSKMYTVHDPERTVARQIRVASMDYAAELAPFQFNPTMTRVQ
jgi:hypothetical protein